MRTIFALLQAPFLIGSSLPVLAAPSSAEGPVEAHDGVDMGAFVAQHVVAGAVAEVLGGENALVVDHAFAVAHIGDAQGLLGALEVFQRDPAQ